MNKKLVFLFVAVIIIVVFSLINVKKRRAPVTPPSEVEAPVKVQVAEKPAKFEFQKGMSYVAWTRTGYSNVNSAESIQELKSLGVQWVCLISTWYQENFDSTIIYPLNDKTASDESLLFIIRKLHDLNIKVMLKPHLDIVNSGGKWR